MTTVQVISAVQC